MCIFKFLLVVTVGKIVLHYRSLANVTSSLKDRKSIGCVYAVALKKMLLWMQLILKTCFKWHCIFHCSEVKPVITAEAQSFCTCVVFPGWFSTALLFSGRIKLHYFPEGCNILTGKTSSLNWTIVLLTCE